MEVMLSKTRSMRRSGFTLVEILVVMIIIAILVGLMFAGIQSARETARKTSCANNLRQIGFALTSYAAKNNTYPSGWQSAGAATDGTVNGWSCQALLLPYLEQQIVSDLIDFKLGYKEVANQVVTTADGSSVALTGVRVPTYLCPSEKRDEQKGVDYPLNYVHNDGIWFVYDPATGTGGAGAFYPDSRLDGGNFSDGLSTTIAFSEAKAFTPYYRNAALAAGSANIDNMPTLQNVAGAGNPVDMRLVMGDGSTNAEPANDGGLKTSGHTEWVDGRCHQSGFTTAFGPNARTVPVAGAAGAAGQSVDWTNWQEGKNDGGTVHATYAAVTARSYHGGGVNTLMMGGSVQWIRDEVNLGVWQALSTRSNADILPNTEQF
jgi:prepilin-type N-terminal cleavage/methylation domain-containing protein/prepilin-type processing-associated H-X9-DG protein